MPHIFLICMLPCTFISHKELRHEFNHTIWLCWDEVLHGITGLLVYVAKWKIKWCKCFLKHFRNRKTPKKFCALPQTLPGLYSWTLLVGSQHPLPNLPVALSLALRAIKLLHLLFSLTSFGHKSTWADLFNVHTHVWCLGSFGIYIHIQYFFDAVRNSKLQNSKYLLDLIKRSSKVTQKNMWCEIALNFDQWTKFFETYKPMSLIMACLQFYPELLLLATFLWVHSNSEEVYYLFWQNSILTWRLLVIST